MRPLNSFFYLFVNFCEVSRRGFSVTLSLSTGVQHFAPTNPMTPAVPSSSVVRHRRCLLPLTRRASLPFIDTQAVFLFIYHVAQLVIKTWEPSASRFTCEVNTEREKKMCLPS